MPSGLDRSWHVWLVWNSLCVYYAWIPEGLFQANVSTCQMLVWCPGFLSLNVDSHYCTLHMFWSPFQAFCIFEIVLLRFHIHLASQCKAKNHVNEMWSWMRVKKQAAHQLLMRMGIGTVLMRRICSSADVTRAPVHPNMLPRRVSVHFPCYPIFQHNCIVFLWVWDK